MGTVKETLLNMINSNKQVMMYNALIDEEQAIKQVKFNPYTIKKCRKSIRTATADSCTKRSGGDPLHHQSHRKGTIRSCTKTS